MTFLQTLKQHNLDYVLADHKFEPIIPHNGVRFSKLLKRIVLENLKVYVDYDCDPDGYFSAKILIETFKRIGFTNYTLCRHTVKRHVLSEAYVLSLIREHYDVIFILDSSTNDMSTIKAISDSDCICCVVDHHVCNFDFSSYPSSSIVINPKIDAHKAEIVYDSLSAGAIMSLLCSFSLQVEFNIKPPVDLYLFGVITLYSDIMNMSNSYNIAFVTRFQNTDVINSDLIRLFWDDRYDHFDRSYISFKLVPRLNALFRTENFSILYELFFEDGAPLADSIIQKIENIYLEAKSYTQHLVSSCTIKKYKDFILAIMSKSSSILARNFTGLVANMVASTYDMPVICLHQTTDFKWGGSVRDPFSRNLLTVFKSICYAEGHKSAFGVEIEVDKIEQSLSLIDGMLPAISDDSVIILNWDTNPKDFRSDLQLMACYNEFGGQDLPIAMGALTIKPDFRIYRDAKKITVYGNSEKFLIFKKAADVGDIMLIKPVLCGSSYTNMVNNVYLK